MTLFAIDTNVLIRLAVIDHPLREPTFAAVRKLVESGHEPVLFPQLIYEFWAVATRSAAANGLGFGADETMGLIREITQEVMVLHDNATVYGHWLYLVESYRVKGVNSHDLRIVAAMRAHGIGLLLTDNDRDFRRYREIQLLKPQSVIADTE